ncbi:unnamed protein product, partial [Staurois parvus]
MDGVHSCHPLCTIVLISVIGQRDHMVQTGPITAYLYYVISCGQSQLITIISHVASNDVTSDILL